MVGTNNFLSVACSAEALLRNNTFPPADCCNFVLIKASKGAKVYLLAVASIQVC